MKTNQYREDQTSGQPSRPSQMTAGEAADLEKFKESLLNAIVGAELDQKAHTPSMAVTTALDAKLHSRRS